MLQAMQDVGKNLAAFVLAGGKSSRMGCDKALMEFRGRPLIEIAVITARTMTDDVRIVGNRPDLQMYAPIVIDSYRECGPLGGIEAALRTTDKEWNLILGVDTPLLPPALLSLLLQHAESSQAQITVPHVEGRYEPLCAIYRRNMLSLVQQALEHKAYRVEGIFQSASLCVVKDQELAAAGIEAAAFANLNTLEEFAAHADVSSAKDQRSDTK